MKSKKITLTKEQNQLLLRFNLDSFKEFGIGYAIKNELYWWSQNILEGEMPTKVNRIQGTTYSVKF